MIAIMVACLASFRQLFVIQDKRTQKNLETGSPQSTISRKLALPRVRLSHSLKRHKPVPLLPTQKSSIVDLPRISSSSAPQGKSGPVRKYESKLEQQIGNDTQLTNTTTKDSSMSVLERGVQDENVAFLPPLQFESEAGTKENLVPNSNG